MAIRRFGGNPASWNGTYYIMCPGKTGELVFLAGVLPALRRRLPAAKVCIITMDHYRFALEHLDEGFRFDRIESLSTLPMMGLVKSVETYNGFYRQGIVQHKDGVITNCYRRHGWFPIGEKRISFFHSFSESVGVPRNEYTRPSWGTGLEDQFGKIAIALPSMNVHSSPRRKLPFSEAQWSMLAEVLSAAGCKCVATGHKDDPRPSMPGWTWLDGDLELALRLVRESEFTIGGNSGMIFLAGLVSRGPVVLLDDHHNNPLRTLVDVANMNGIFPDRKISQIKLDWTPRRDLEAFQLVLGAADAHLCRKDVQPIT